MRAMLKVAAAAALLIGMNAIPLAAQDAEPVAGPDPVAGAEDADALVSEEELDALVAPVALYPDSVLTQIFVASTVPIDVVKADRFLSDNAEMDPKARADAVEGENWDASVQVLAGGFPTVIERMAADIDWTEDLGDAVMAQTDGVLDAVQRMRARAVALGNLETNEAQTVEAEGDTIAIEPADPEIVYLPSYDPAMTFTSTAPAPPVVVSEPGMSTTDLVTTGAIAFGSALLINEIFDDDDDWDDYWHGSQHIDWDNDDFYPRPGVKVDGDVNIDVDRNNIRRRVDADGDRIGNLDGDRLGGGAAWRPSDDQRQAARDKLASRDRPEGSGEARDRIRARADGGGGGGGGGADARERLERAKAERPAQRHRPDASSAIHPRGESRDHVRRASERGAKSANHGDRARPAASQNRSKGVSRPTAAKRPAAQHAPQRASSFKKGHGGGDRARKASGRGHGHKAGGRGGRRR